MEQVGYQIRKPRAELLLFQMSGYKRHYLKLVVKIKLRMYFIKNIKYYKNAHKIFHVFICYCLKYMLPRLLTLRICYHALLYEQPCSLFWIFSICPFRSTLLNGSVCLGSRPFWTASKGCLSSGFWWGTTGGTSRKGEGKRRMRLRYL